MGIAQGSVLSAVCRVVLGHAPPKKIFKIGFSEIRFQTILALLMAELVCRVFQYVCLY